jgi:transcriptional regulator with XRE-family HTH domain
VTKNFLNDPGNLEFKELLAHSKWTQSETARQLKVSPGLVSQYLSGLTRPSTTTLMLFRMVLKEKDQLTQGVAVPGSVLASLREDSDRLAEIARTDPDKFETVHEVITMAYSNLPKKKGKRKRA